MPLPDLLPIQPFTHPVSGSVVLPGSKSLTNRALLLAALCSRPVTLTGALFSEDTRIMAEALKTLGFTVELRPEKNEIYIEGRGGKIPAENATLHVGLAGTAARFLTAFCAASPRGVYRIDGVPQMRKRPMKGLFDALSAQGAEIVYLGEHGFFPIELHAHGLRGNVVEIDAGESSQMLSALLMVAPLAAAPLEITLLNSVRWPFVQMTANLIRHFGQPGISRIAENRLSIRNETRYSIPSSFYKVEPDATAASYFAALPLVSGGHLLLNALTPGLQGDTDFLGVLGKVGLNTRATDDGFAVSFTLGAARHGVTEDFREFSDTFLTLAAIAPLLDGPTQISGIGHTRKQETDRIAGAAQELRKLGQNVNADDEADDILTISPNLEELRRRASQGPLEVGTYGDHRFAMSFAILGCYDLLGTGQPWLAIKNPACCEKTFPGFFDELARLHAVSHNVAS
jgi:3-phosphoshikimate 1-carboxyvinyltransferase